MFCAEAQSTATKECEEGRIDDHWLPTAHHQSEGRIAMRHCLTAVWRAIHRLAALMALCRLLIDLVRELRNAVQNHRRAGMRGNELFRQGE